MLEVGLYPISLIEKTEQVVNVCGARLFGVRRRINLTQNIHHVVEVLPECGEVELELLAPIWADHRLVPTPEAFVELKHPQITLGVRQADVIPIDEGEVLVIVPDDIAARITVRYHPRVLVLDCLGLQAHQGAVVRGHEVLVGA